MVSAITHLLVQFRLLDELISDDLIT